METHTNNWCRQKHTLDPILKEISSLLNTIHTPHNKKAEIFKGSRFEHENKGYIKQLHQKYWSLFTFSRSRSQALISLVHDKGKEQTWVNLLEIKQCSYTIFVFFLKFSHAVENNLRVIWSKYTAKYIRKHHGQLDT